MNIRLSNPSEIEKGWMRRAADLAKSCETESGRSNESPRVAAIAVGANGDVIAEAYRGEFLNHSGDHAEYLLVQKSGGPGSGQLKGAIVYTTLEPCTSRSEGKTPCAMRLVDEGVDTVFIGMFDPDPRIREKGWLYLQNAGIKVHDFVAEMREDIVELNRPFIERYQQGSGITGSATFDYEQNNGEFEITHWGATFLTRWSKSGIGSIQALGEDGTIALARFGDLDQIDDPSAYEFRSHVKRPREGQVVIYRSGDDFCLVRVESALSGVEYGHDRTEVSITWELRLADGDNQRETKGACS